MEKAMGLALGIITGLAGIAVIGWKWMLVSGVLSLMLGLLIWSQWPISGMWAMGVLVGVNLLGTGLALVTLASTLNKPLERRA